MITDTSLSLNKAREIIGAWDFSPIIERSVMNGMPRHQADIAVTELKEYLFQRRALPDIPLSPQTVACDYLWHEFISADTRAYFSFCNAVYGEYLHHDGVTRSQDGLKVSRENSAAIFGTRISAQVECN